MKEQEEDSQFTEFEELDFGGIKETDEKAQFVEKNIWLKLAESGKKISFAKDILALINFMRDPLVSWQKKAIVVAGLIYFITPIDAIPDFIPLVGYLDDLGVIAALLKFLGKELTPYYNNEPVTLHNIDRL
ncbi:MAG: YkvA family protein [Bacteroidota bacterium]|nr:YkvA family protein [Bacteroidota bacterium]